MSTNGNQPKYRWPWLVLALFVLAVLLAIVWMSALVKRIQRQREPSESWPRPTLQVCDTPVSFEV